MGKSELELQKDKRKKTKSQSCVDLLMGGYIEEI